MWLSRSVISVSAGKSKSMAIFLDGTIFKCWPFYVSWSIAVCFLSLYKSEWKNAPKSADKCFRSKSVRDSYSHSLNLYWIMHYLIWPFLFHTPLHFSKIDSSIGSLLSPIVWDWLKPNRGKTPDRSHILSITGYTNNSVSSFTAFIGIKIFSDMVS